MGFILAKTAKKVDKDIAEITFTPKTTSTTIGLQSAWMTNTAGFNFHPRYGFGMVDAAAAVKMSKGFASISTIIGRRKGGDIDSTKLTTTPAGAATSAINWGNTYILTQSFNAFTDATAYTGTMQMDVTITNNTGAPLNIGQLQLELFSKDANGEVKSILLPAFTSFYQGSASAKNPDGTSADQADINLLAAGGTQTLRVFTNAFYGQKLSASTWSFKALNVGSTKAISVSNVSLTSYGM